MVYPTFPSSPASSSPVTVTVWGASQSPDVKVRLDWSTVPSAGLLEVTSITTSSVGSDPSTTVNCADPPDSVVSRPLVGETVMVTSSSSVLVALTSSTDRPL